MQPNVSGKRFAPLALNSGEVPLSGKPSTVPPGNSGASGSERTYSNSTAVDQEPGTE